jgi:5-methylcytosine-specific restriction endonuclease McrA
VCDCETSRTPTNICRPCKKASDAKYYAENKDKIKANVAEWTKDNHEKKLQTVRDWNKNNVERAVDNRRQWRENNKDKARDLQKSWRTNNLERARKTSREYMKSRPDLAVKAGKARRTRKENGDLAMNIPKHIKARLVELQQGLCPCCGLPLGNNPHFDHVVALANGGQHSLSNLQLLRPECNMAKGIRDPIEYMQSKGFLL